MPRALIFISSQWFQLIYTLLLSWFTDWVREPPWEPNKHFVLFEKSRIKIKNQLNRWFWWCFFVATCFGTFFSCFCPVRCLTVVLIGFRLALLSLSVISLMGKRELAALCFFGLWLVYCFGFFLLLYVIVGYVLWMWLLLDICCTIYNNVDSLGKGIMLALFFIHKRNFH